MKTNATLNNAMPPDIRTCPPELRVASQEVIRHIVGLMNLHGIKSLRADVTMVGAKALTECHYEDIAGAVPPPTFLQIKAAAAQALIDYMVLMGIHGIDTEPSAADVAVLNAGYTELTRQSVLLATNAAPKSAPNGDPSDVPVELPGDLNV